MIDLSNESSEEVDTQALIRLARFALDKLRIHPQADLSILLVDVDTMTAYHKQFMNLDGPTDVMSFPMDELREPADGEAPPRGLLGDIVICPAFTSAQAPG
ncbi:rRNA maturation RNase YbeY, partial [Propionibacterium freudenreichii]|nr:rRNA maturation RNase YbeY [Propionibacterium freudenreichii]